MKLRLAKVEDAENIIRWSLLREQQNAVDTEVLAYPATDIFCAENGKVVAFLPVQLVGMFESLAVNPKASNHEVAAAYYKLVDAIVETAHKLGIREMYFLGSDEQTNRFAERLGFERMDMPCYRLKLPEKMKCESTED